MVDGHLCCKIYFEKQVFEAAVRIMVTAEDGTEKKLFCKTVYSGYDSTGTESCFSKQNQ